MTLEEAIEVAERLEKEDCIGTTSQALRTLLRAFKELSEGEKEGGCYGLSKTEWHDLKQS